MVDYGYMDVDVTCPTHGGVTETIRVYGSNGDVVYQVVEDQTNGDFFTAKVTITVSGSVVAYVHN